MTLDEIYAQLKCSSNKYRRVVFFKDHRHWVKFISNKRGTFLRDSYTRTTVRYDSKIRSLAQLKRLLAESIKNNYIS